MDGSTLNLVSHPARRPRAPRMPPRFSVHRVRPGPWLQVGSITSFEWTRVELSIEDLPPPLHGLRVIHLSDLHLRPRWCRVYDSLVQRVSHEPPDLIVITGDFVEHRGDHRKTLPTLKRFITQLRSRHGIYGILGNHDGDLLGPRLREWDVEVICGRVVRLETEDAAIELVGIPSVSRRDLGENSLQDLPRQDDATLRLVLAHFPDSLLKLRDIEADVVLAGHTHGGQVCLPGGIPIVTHDALPRSLCRGVHRVDDKLLIVNRGIGFASLPMRVFCPPEVIEICFSS